MEGPPLGPGGEDITWPNQVAPRGRKASSTRKIKPQTSNLKTSAVLHLMLQACYYMQKIWRHVGPVPMDQRQRYASMVTQFTKAWGALGWSVPVWVHWVVCHSGAHLQRWGNFIKFSSIPTEWRNKSFKMDIRHCFRG